jgi:hypothetical protein
MCQVRSGRNQLKAVLAVRSQPSTWVDESPFGLTSVVEGSTRTFSKFGRGLTMAQNSVAARPQNWQYCPGVLRPRECLHQGILQREWSASCTTISPPHFRPADSTLGNEAASGPSILLPSLASQAMCSGMLQAVSLGHDMSWRYCRKMEPRHLKRSVTSRKK